MDMSPLVSTEWLAEHMGDPDLRIVDVRWKFREENGKGVGYDDRAGYDAGHIPGAVFVRVAEELCDPDHPLPDMIAPPERFAAAMERAGVDSNSHVVVYDDSGVPLGAARLWWALSYFGHERVQVLDGGLLQWQMEERPVSNEVPEISAAEFECAPRPDWIAEKQDVLDAIGKPDTVIVDCLANELYRGEAAHTWGARRGHVPGAVNIPAVANLDPSLAMTPMAKRAERLKARGSFRFASKTALEAHYRNAGVPPDKPVIAYCGRGIAASCGMLAMRYLGIENARLYDGSWAEWSSDENLPVEVSE